MRRWALLRGIVGTTNLALLACKRNKKNTPSVSEEMKERRRCRRIRSEAVVTTGGSDACNAQSRCQSVPVVNNTQCRQYPSPQVPSRPVPVLSQSQASPVPQVLLNKPPVLPRVEHTCYPSMPNLYQVAFLASLFFTFSSLVLLSNLITSKLANAGFHFSHLILIGLPDIPPPPHRVQVFDNNIMSFLIPNNLHAVQLPLLGSVDLVALSYSPAFIFTAIVVVATGIYSNILHTGRTKPLNPDAWQEYPLEKKIIVSPNTAMYRFKLPHVQDVLGLPVGQHISVSAEIEGKTVTRSYTPVNNDDDRGHFDLLIKTYEMGNISKYISKLKIGDTIRVKGPKGNFRYKPEMTGHLSLIAGGTGITPMIQIIRAALRNPFDPTTVSLIYANVNEEDILLKDDLEELLDVHELKFKIFYVLNNPPPGWKGGVGYVTKEHIKEHIPNPNTSDSKILICGPPPMVSAMKKNLADLNYPAPQTVSKVDDKVFVF